MDTTTRMNGGPSTYTVEVKGVWMDPRTRETMEHTERYNVLAGHQAAAETAATQLYGAAAAAQRCYVAGECSARAGA